MTPEEWQAIAGEVAGAIGEVGMICTLRRPPATPTGTPQANPYDDDSDPDNPTDYAITAYQSMEKLRDERGTFIGRTVTKLTMDAGGVVPLKSDTVAVNVAPSDVTDETRFHEITDVETLAPGGVALKYEIVLAD